MRTAHVSEVAQLRLPVPYLGFVNLWLLEGEPLTLVDTGPANPEAFAALETELAAHDRALEEIELVLVTHHHLDHSGLATAIKERSGATIAAHTGTARWGVDYHERAAAERRFTEGLMAEHGVPESLITASEPFFQHIVRDSRSYDTDQVLNDGDTIRAGGRTLRVVFRPGHSTTDTLFVDDDDGIVFVGDHLLADISSGAEIMPTELPGDERRRALLEYLGNLRKTEAMEIASCFPGHGPVIEDHKKLIAERLAFHSERLDQIAGHVRDGCGTAFEVARKLWSDEVAETQPVLVIWEVLGHLDILVNRGTVREHVDDRGHHHFRAKEAVGLAAGTS
jgi:glyoxylase-like metal-dependent hydrolase (beta-lactamase superfamily II)